MTLTAQFSVPKTSGREDWLGLARAAATEHDSSMWKLGDLMQAPPPEIANLPVETVAALIGGAAVGRLRVCRSLARRFPPGQRRSGGRVGPAHHLEVLGLPSATAGALLDQAVEEGWTVADLRRAARKAKADRKVDADAAKQEVTVRSSRYPALDSTGG